MKRAFKRDDAVRTKRGKHGIIAGNIGANFMGEWLYGVRWDKSPNDIDIVVDADLISVDKFYEEVGKRGGTGP